MKKTGSTTEFSRDRDKALINAYESVKNVRRRANVRRISAEIVKMPASRFWVSEERARAVVGEMLRGLDPLSTMREPKQRMYREICRRVLIERNLDPSVPMIELVTRVIYSPAPEFYMEAAHASYLIYKYLRNRNSL